jgi:hypothetical protein
MPAWRIGIAHLVPTSSMDRHKGHVKVLSPRPVAAVEAIKSGTSLHVIA